MKHFRIYFFLPLLLLLLVTCKNADSPTGIDANGNTITTIAGMINDENGEPIEGVTVTANGKTANTNEYGTFMIQNATVPSPRCFIICKKNGYFTGSRAETPKGGGITEFRLTMQSNTANFSLDATLGGKISVGSASVSFPAASVVDANGAPYTGKVNVAAKFLDPTQKSFYNSFSGDFAGKRLDGRQTELLSYGVLRVHITDASGNELKLAEGKTATLTYPIAASMQKDAPASIPLWYFDESLGMWKEEGSAVKSGDYYTGVVSHFTDWNCDHPEQTGLIKGRVMCNNDGIGSINVTVGQRKVITDANGYFVCRVPVNLNVIVSVNPVDNLDLTGNDISVPPFVSAGDEYNLTFQLAKCPAFVTGTLVDCNSKPIAGRVTLYFKNNFKTLFTNTGSFKSFVFPNTEVTIEATSFNGKIAIKRLIGIVNSGDTKDIGQISACEEGNEGEHYDFKIDSDHINHLVLSPDGSMFAISGHYRNAEIKFTQIYDVKTGLKLMEVVDSLTSYATNTVNFSDDGTKILIQGIAYRFRIFNPRTGTLIREFSGFQSCRMLPDGSAVIAYNPKVSIKQFAMYSVDNGLKIKDFSFDEEALHWNLLGISRANQIVLINQSLVQNKPRIIYWDINSNTKTSDVLLPDIYSYTKGRFSEDLSVIVTTNNKKDTGTLNFYNSQTGTKQNPIPIPYNFMWGGLDDGSIAISNDMKYVIQQKLTNVQTPLSPSINYLENGMPFSVLPVAFKSSYQDFTFSADNKYLAAREYNSIPEETTIVRIWKVK